MFRGEGSKKLLILKFVFTMPFCHRDIPHFRGIYFKSLSLPPKAWRLEFPEEKCKSAVPVTRPSQHTMAETVNLCGSEESIFTPERHQNRFWNLPQPRQELSAASQIPDSQLPESGIPDTQAPLDGVSTLFGVSQPVSHSTPSLMPMQVGAGKALLLTP